MPASSVPLLILLRHYSKFRLIYVNRILNYADLLIYKYYFVNVIFIIFYIIFNFT